ncbi:ABC transporter ATP-binding protein [Bacillus sp. Hm123]|uniref:ABC transporter ATP-binding protein n=1 Tax=Bacillus sp. Hm123 TaxID=3450745 RepID=UPI003F426C79
MFETSNLTVHYGKKEILKDFSLFFPDKSITSIIGPNGCGKSTLVKTLARIIQPTKGAILIDGKDLQELHTKDIAKKIAMLPQSAQAPSGVTVVQLVSYGRFPHQNQLSALKQEDYEAIHWALNVCGLDDLKDTKVDQLSGGQRQRVWIALSLAQQTEMLILDEPTTYLDMSFQLELLTLLKDLHEKQQYSIVMVLHDLNHASRFSDYLVGMKDGKVIVHGTPEQVMTEENIQLLFNIEASIVTCPYSGKPLCQAFNLNQTGTRL